MCLKIVVSKWRRGEQGYQLPHSVDYTLEHVLTLRNMFQRHLQLEHQLVLLTDDPKEADGVSGIQVIPLWDKYRRLGGCYNRLYLFSEDMRELIGPRFAHIDLDVVLTGDVTPIFSRTEPFLIHRYQPKSAIPKQQAGTRRYCRTRRSRHKPQKTPPTRSPIQQGYNGGLFMMDAGARSEVWSEFDRDPEQALTTLRDLTARRKVIGSDQAWIRHMLGDKELTLGPEHGIYESRNVGQTLPDNARMVFFAGKSDPTTSNLPWVKQCYH